MFKKLSGLSHDEIRLDVDSSGNPTEEDLLIATGVLLLQMAGSDSDYAAEEVKAIFAIMKNEFNILDNDVKHFLGQANQLRNDKARIDEFVQVINTHFSTKQRIRVLAMLWRVILADGKVDKFETNFAIKMKFSLMLTDQEAEQARQLALQKMV
ncbi:MAG: TerB family tellurite resistance protein [Deltaproteobacteria bacterium]|nr:TerB family tellurite resistance protein [Deltaproteobacteria bacterium]